MSKLKVINRVNAGWNAGQNYYARMMRPEEIKIDPEIAGIFRIKEETVAEIVRSIKENDYDKSQPLVIWKGQNILVDGHTRLAAVNRLEMEEVPVVEKEFEDREDAILYTFDRQVLRRNLEPGEILAAAMLLKQRKEKDGNGRAAEQLAKRLGVGVVTIYHARKVGAEAPEADIKAVQKGEKTIGEVYEKLKKNNDALGITKPRKEVKETSNDNDDTVPNIEYDKNAFASNKARLAYSICESANKAKVLLLSRSSENDELPSVESLEKAVKLLNKIMRLSKDLYL
jgi:ParB-like chromosome segregation protein Spo0J